MIILSKLLCTCTCFRIKDSKRAYTFLFIIIFIITGPSVPFADTNESTGYAKVKVMKLKPEAVDIKVTSIARLYPNKEINVLAEVPGMIIKYNFDVGDKVEKDQVLLKIDPTDYQLALEDTRAKLLAVNAQLLSSQKKYARAKELTKKKLISGEKYEDSEFAYTANQASAESAKIAVKIAEQRLKKTTIKAPFSGLIGSRIIEIGQIVEPGTVLLSLVDLAQVRAKVYVVEEDYVHIDKKDPVKVSIEAYPERVFSGKIDKIGIVADKKNSTFSIDVIIENSNIALKAGFSAHVSITSLNLPNVYHIPIDAVIYGGDGAGVLIVDSDNLVQRKLIRTGKTENNLIQVFEGLNSDNLVIIRGQNTVKPSERVTISE